MANLVEGLIRECNRVRAILPHYEALGPVGAFGAAMLTAAIQEGEAALGSGDIVRIARAYKALEDCAE